MLILKVLLILSLLYLTYQDIKERQVYWILIILSGLIFSYLHFSHTVPSLFIINISMNLVFISLLILIVFLYSKLKLNIHFREALGLGDLLLFIALAFSFATVSFLIAFIFSLVFSLILHLALNSRKNVLSVPLAGHMSLFFAIICLAQWSGVISNLYSI